jgi:hypothetical protein
VMPSHLHITDRVKITGISRYAGRTGTIVNIGRDCSGVLYYVKIDGRQVLVGKERLSVIDSHRAGLKKLKLEA